MKDSTQAHSYRHHLTPLLIRGGAVALLVFCMGNLACWVKHTVRVAVPSNILKARTATLDELVSLIDSNSVRIKSLSSQTLRVTFTSGKTESGRLQVYTSVPGYILLRWPDDILMNIQNPLIKTTIVELLSAGDDFSLWLPSKNQFFKGKNSTKEFASEGVSHDMEFTARPIHIFQAILPSKIPLDEQDVFIGMEESQDAGLKYYVVSVYRQEGAKRLRSDRKIWIERAGLTISRQVMYGDEGKISGVIKYSNPVIVEGVFLPLSIYIDRPLDGYSLDMQFKDWRVNPDLPADAFVKTPPPGAQVVPLREKQRSEIPQK